MDNSERLRRNNLIEAYLESKELQIVDFRLGSFTELSDPAISEYRILQLSDIGRGFAYTMVMPWTKSEEPLNTDIVLYLKDVRDQFNAIYERDGQAADPPLHLASNADELDGSGFGEHLPQLCSLANGESLPE